jgi:hypothetical protein
MEFDPLVARKPVDRPSGPIFERRSEPPAPPVPPLPIVTEMVSPGVTDNGVEAEFVVLFTFVV